MADESLIPSISSGAVGSRFVSQTDIDTAKARRDEQWKAAYARLGQEPPPQPQDDSYDGRSLAEKLAANRVAKEEEWEEKTKLANQFRALEEDEIMFLDSVREAQEEEERQRKERDGEELKGFREAVAAKVVVKSPPAVPSSTSNAPPSNPAQAKTNGASTVPRPPPKKDTKKSLKGVLVKKKPKPAVESKSATPNVKEKAIPEGGGTKARKDDADSAPPDAKRRKVSQSGS